MTTGSRWYYRHWEGLIDAKHVKQMGMALWLYEYLISRAHVARRNGLLEYTHVEAAQVLGKTERTIKTWFKALQQQGYISIATRRPYHLEVQVTKWRSFEEWENARQVGDVQYFSPLPGGNGERSEERSEGRSENQRHHTITIKLSSYEYPTGSPAEPARCCLTDAFREMLESLKTVTNMAAALRDVYILCFGAADVPSYGYLGKAAKAVGGAGRLAQLMWDVTTNPPTGDVLAYLMATDKHRRQRQGGQQDGVPRGKAAIAAWSASKAGSNGK